MTDSNQRLLFGIAAFVIATAVIGLVLSPLVSPDKYEIAYIIVGNVLGWPFMVLAFHYGASVGGKQSRDLLDRLLERNTGIADAARSTNPPEGE